MSSVLIILFVLLVIGCLIIILDVIRPKAFNILAVAYCTYNGKFNVARLKVKNKQLGLIEAKKLVHSVLANMLNCDSHIICESTCNRYINIYLVEGKYVIKESFFRGYGDNLILSIRNSV